MVNCYKSVINFILRGVRMNIYDIAEKAGVSVATVSRVINNSANVSEKTAARSWRSLTRSGMCQTSLPETLIRPPQKR